MLASLRVAPAAHRALHVGHILLLGTGVTTPQAVRRGRGLRRCRTSSCCRRQRLSATSNTFGRIAAAITHSKQRSIHPPSPLTGTEDADANSASPIRNLPGLQFCALQPRLGDGPRSEHVLSNVRRPVSTKDPIPEEMDHREIAVRVSMMDKVQLLFAPEPCKPLKPRSLYMVFLVEKDVRVERRGACDYQNYKEICWQ